MLYWLPTRAAIAAYFIVGIKIGIPIDQSLVTDTVIISLFIIFLWTSLMIEVKRWHDRNKSGWWILIVLLPVIGPLWALAECGFFKGTEGANHFGPDPLAA